MDTVGTGCEAYIPCISVCKAGVFDTLPAYVEASAISHEHFVLLNCDFSVTKLMIRTKASYSMAKFVFYMLTIERLLEIYASLKTPNNFPLIYFEMRVENSSCCLYIPVK
jgi:hypothetical protein